MSRRGYVDLAKLRDGIRDLVAQICRDQGISNPDVDVQIHVVSTRSNITIEVTEHLDVDPSRLPQWKDN